MNLSASPPRVRGAPASRGAGGGLLCVLGLGSLLTLSACSGPGLACTEMSAVEHVSVDLAEVVDPASGEHVAEVCVDRPRVCDSLDVVGEYSDLRFGYVAAGLDGQEVGVSVEVRDAAGQVVHTARGVQEPVLFQPNGPRCDGENYALRVRAAADGTLVPSNGDLLEGD